MVLVSNVRYPSMLVFLGLLLAAPSAQADPVTHQFTGTLTTITDGGGGMLDLRSVFSLGQPVTLEYTIERNTASMTQDPYTLAYNDAITSISFSIDTWSGSGTPGFSITTVSDNVVPGGYDQYSAQAQGGMTAPPLGGTIMFQSLTYTFDDVQGTVFESKEIPGTFPNLSAFEGKTLTMLFFDFSQLKSGYVMATLTGVSTATQPSTWGNLKALYR